MKKICSRCGKEMDASNFSKEASKRDGLSRWCVTCKKEYRDERGWQTEKLSLYGITEQQYTELLSSQDNRCAICGNDAVTLEVDHNHKSGLVRGMLCGKCNRGIGMFHDDAALLRKAACYVVDRESDAEVREALKKQSFT